MIRRIGLIAALAAATVVALLSPTGAAAATNLGATFDPNPCESNTTYIQTVSPGNAYTVPFSGVITSWSYQAAAGFPAATAKLKIGRVAPSTDLTNDATVSIVGESAPQLPTSTLNTFPSRVPVQAGDLVGEFLGSSSLNVGCSRQDDAYTDHYASQADVSPGTSDTFTQENFQQDIAAVLERDADNDGFGDETQDQCPSNAGTQGPCPVTAPVKKKKCKRHKKHHSAQSAKKKKCKKHRKK